MYVPRVSDSALNRSSQSTSVTPQMGSWDSPNSCAILRELFYSSYLTAAIMDVHWPVWIQCVGDLY